MIPVVLSFMGCKKNDLFQISVSEESIFYCETAAALEMENLPLCFVYTYQNNTFLASKKNQFKSSSIKVLDESSLEIKLEDAAPYDYIVANKLPIKHSDYGVFRKTSDNQNFFDGLFRSRYVTGGLQGEFLLAINSETKLATIYFFRTGLIIRKAYELDSTNPNYPTLTINELSLGQGPEKWIMRYGDHDVEDVYMVEFIDESGYGWIYSNSLVPIDKKYN